MVREVWGDLYFLINAGMDLICLMITAALLHRKIKRWRAILASLLGGLYALLALLLGGGGIWGLFADCGTALLLAAITFWERNMRAWRLLQAAGVELLTSMLLGGVMTGLYSLLSRLELPLESLEGEGLSVWVFLLLSAVAALVAGRGGRIFASRAAREVEVEAVLFGKRLTLHAMVDSGNLLRDPVSGRGVIVADRSLLLAALPPDLSAALAESDPARWIEDSRRATRIRLIPTRTATGDALLPAILPDSLILREKREALPSDYLIAPGALGESANGFDAVLPAE